MASKKPWVIVLAGGSGTRFWPASSRERPKHLLPLVEGGSSLLRATVERLDGLTDLDHVVVVTAADQAQAVRDDLDGLLQPENLVVEPVPRNTAPAIALAMVQLGLRGVGPHEPVIVLPSDHWVADVGAFHGALRRACEAAVEHKAILTLGVEPSFPSTGFGYLGLGKVEPTEGEGADVRRVLQFKEKPTPQVAQEYVDSGNWLWNAGIFVFRLGYLWYVMGDLREDLDVAMQVLSACLQQEDWPALLEEYSKLEAVSIDYAVMEDAPSMLAVAADFGWQDLGSWDAVQGLLEEGAGGWSRSAGLFAEDARDNVVFAPGRKVALLGVEGLVVVATDEGVLVTRRDRAQDVRAAAEALSAPDPADAEGSEGQG